LLNVDSCAADRPGRAPHCDTVRVGELIQREVDVALENRALQPNAIRIKGMTIRAYLHYVARQERRQEIMAWLPADTVALIENPPLPTTWLEWRHLEDIVVAVEKVQGMDGVRYMSERTIEESRRPYVRALEGLIRLFGTSPATIYKRMNDIVRNSIENTEYNWVATSTRSGTMEVVYGGDRTIPDCIFVGGVPAIAGILHFCGVRGVVSEPRRLGPRQVRYEVTW
jgi:hypothetical protein